MLLLLKIYDPPQTIVVCLWGGSNRDSIYCFILKKKNDRHFLSNHSSVSVSIEFSYIIRVHLPLAVFHNYGGAKQYQFSAGQYSFTTGHIRNTTLPNAGRSFWFSSSVSTIPPAPKPKETAVSWSSHCVNKKSPCDYARDRVEKYEQYFKDGEILPVPELVEAVEP